MNCQRQLLAVVLTVSLGLVGALLDELLFFGLIVEGAANRIEIVALPVSFGSLSLHNFVVGGDLSIVVLNVLVRHWVVLARHIHTLVAVLFSGCIRRRSLLWRLEVVLLHVDIRNDVVVLKGVLAGAEVPGLLLGVVVPGFKALQLVVEVDHVVGLLVAERGVSILGEHINHVLLLGLLNSLLGVGVVVHLRDRVVQEVLGLDELGGHLLVGLCLALEVALLFDVLVNVGLPLLVALGKTVLLRKLSDICN